MQLQYGGKSLIHSGLPLLFYNPQNSTTFCPWCVLPYLCNATRNPTGRRDGGEHKAIMTNNIIYQVSAEDLRQFGMDLIASVREMDEADRKRSAEQELQPIPFVADYLHVNEQTIRNMIARGCIRVIRVGRRVMCDMTKLRKDVEAGKVGRGKHTKARR